MNRWMDGISTLFFDLDGCIYFGRKLAERANDLMDLLRGQGYRIGFITNNSRENSAEIGARLAEMGLQLEGELIISATEAAAAYLKDVYGLVAVKVSGSASLNASLENAGHRVLDWAKSDPADVVVIGRDTKFDYRRLEQIVNEVARGRTSSVRIRIICIRGKTSGLFPKRDLSSPLSSRLRAVRS